MIEERLKDFDKAIGNIMTYNEDGSESLLLSEYSFYYKIRNYLSDAIKKEVEESLDRVKEKIEILDNENDYLKMEKIISDEKERLK